MSFVQIEKDFIRKNLLPDFDWTTFEEPSVRHTLKKPLNECTVALVGTAGAHLENQEKFDIRTPEGDDSYREIPSSTETSELRLSHIGYQINVVKNDPNTVFPLDTLREIKSEGYIDTVSPRSFCFMGYIPRPEKLITERAPEIADKLRQDCVDVVLLVPA